MFKKFMVLVSCICRWQCQASKIIFCGLTFCSIIAGIIPIVNAYALGKLIETVSLIVTGGLTEYTDFYIWMGVLAMAATVSSMLSFVRWRFNYILFQKACVVARQEVILKLYDLNQEQFDNQDFNVKVDRSRETFEQITRISSTLMDSLSSLIAIVLAFVTIAFVSPLILVIVVGMLIPEMIIDRKLNHDWEKTANDSTTLERSSFYSLRKLTEPRSMVEVRLVNAFRKTMHHWKQHKTRANDKRFDFFRRNAYLEILRRLLNPAAQIIATIVLFYRFILTKDPSLSSFFFIRGIAVDFANKMSSLNRNISVIYGRVLAFNSLEDVNQAQPAIADGQVKVSPPFSIEFKDVSFSYPGTDKLVLKNISFTIEAGQHLALVGENGSGKTTTLKLIMRHYLPTDGVIEINGNNIKDLSIDSYQKLISYLGQEFFLLHHLTIRQNLLIDKDRDVDQGAIWRSLEMAGADKIVKDLPLGLETRLDPSFKDGTKLSTGQQQRICIARSFLGETYLLAFDEPTSAIDVKAELKIFNNIFKNQEGRSVLAVSHKLSSVRNADNIIVLDKGRIAETGTHNQLMNQKGLYLEMFNLQSRDYH